MNSLSQSLEDRLLQKRRIMPNGCWEWMGGRTGSGHGAISVGNRTCCVHRVAYEVWVGVIPEGLTIHHKCRNRACIRPDHLEALVWSVHNRLKRGVFTTGVLVHVPLAPPTVKERLLAKVEVNEIGCWIWKGKRNPAGYGKIKVQGKEHYAHRVSWEVHRGAIPPKLVIDHQCPNKSCVNPSHLKVTTDAENIRRAHLGRRWPNRKRGPAKKPPIRFCKRDHEFTEQNTRIAWQNGKPRRVCRECAKLNQRRYRAAAKESND